MAPSSILGRLTRALSSASRTTTLIILAAATIMGMTAAISGFGLGAERQAQMWRDTIRSRPATGKLVLVEIDARSLAALDHWPWPRSYHALAIEALRSEEHTSELQSLMRISYAVFCLKKKIQIFNI